MKNLIVLLFMAGTSSIHFVSAQTCAVSAGTITASSPRTYCSGDGIADVVTVTVSGAVGANYRIVYTNANGIIQLIQQGNTFNFEGFSSATLNARGISYEDGLQGLTVGSSINNLAGCFAWSATVFSITVFNNEAGSISTNGNTTVSLCVDDGTSDVLPITFTGFDAFGIEFAVTDLNDNILSLAFNSPNFEGTGEGTVRLWLISSCFETFDISVGTNIHALPSNFDISNAITVIKNTGCGAPVCAPEVKACPGKVLMCVNGVSTCVNAKQVNRLLRAGATRGGCIVCINSQNSGASSNTTSRAAITADDEPTITTISPNPADRSFSIYRSVLGESTYELYSPDGAIIWRKSVEQTDGKRIDVSLEHVHLKAGIYYLHTKTGDVTNVQRVMIGMK